MTYRQIDTDGILSINIYVDKYYILNFVPSEKASTLNFFYEGFPQKVEYLGITIELDKIGWEREIQRM